MCELPGLLEERGGIFHRMIRFVRRCLGIRGDRDLDALIEVYEHMHAFKSAAHLVYI